MIEIPFGPLHKATFMSRLNRFLLNCSLDDGREVEVHLADPGRLKELLIPGNSIWLRHIDNPRRRTQWSAVLTQDPQSMTLVSLQSTLANTIVQQALQSDALPEFAGWTYKRAEYSFASSRWDFLLEDASGRKLLLEVKSVTLVKDQVALFPDAVTARGRRHVLELAELKSQGEFETAVLFVVQRTDAQQFAPDKDVDPAFAEALRTAHKAGVQVFVRTCDVSLEKVTLAHPLPVNLEDD